MRISWKTPCIQDLIPDLNSLLSDFNCEVVVDGYGRATLRDFAGSNVSWNALEANGVVYLLNRTILHPLGYSLYLIDGVSPGFDVVEENEFSYSLEDRLRYDRALSSVLEEKYPMSGISTTEGN
ncbi:hypothetical protein BA096_01330 [Salmonella enterica]|nr:hypothetical protein [Salmonella enterica]